MFDVFYGDLDTAPMIEQCKVTMEVKLIDHIKLPTHDLFVGEIVGTYADVDVLTNGVVDIAKLKPLLFDMASKKYWSLGEPWPSAGAWARSSSPEADALLLFETHCVSGCSHPGTLCEAAAISFPTLEEIKRARRGE